MTTRLASTKHIVRYVNQALNLLNLYHRCANEHYVLPRQGLSYTHQIEANLSNTRQHNLYYESRTNPGFNWRPRDVELSQADMAEKSSLWQ